ncbi:enoyl-CoA hydratase/isomerase family protein, partial [Klebsiella pneumoniae]|nr:enoyl-CoA hydratase/isomerase family protein [Klebsiella pneumoniae]
KSIGLAHEVTTPEQLDSKIDEIVEALLLGGPAAQSASKQLIQLVDQQVLTEDLLLKTAQHIAHIRQGDEAKNGLNAFLNKQSPA